MMNKVSGEIVYLESDLTKGDSPSGGRQLLKEHDALGGNSLQIIIYVN